MIFSFPRAGAALLAACLFPLSPLRAEPGHVFPPLTQDEMTAIAAATPAKASVSPAKRRAILVFFRTEGYVHASIPYINEAIRQIGERTGAFRADFSDDMSVFTPENLARYDAIVFQNTTRLDFKNPAQRRALLDFVKSGKGFVGIHAASDNFYTWPEAQAMLGGVFHNHPWSSIDTEAVKVDDPGHPVVAAFGGKGFWIREEIYEITGPYARDKQRVLLSLDMSKAEDYRDPADLVRTDADFPIAWVKNYGKGRVFYSSLGHNPSLFKEPEILQFYLDGIQFAVGDLPADAAPADKPVTAALAPVPSLPLQDRGYRNSLPADYLEKLASYDFGPDRVPLVAVDIYLRAQGPKVYPAVEQSLLTLLARPALPDGAKDYVLRTLTVIGSEASVPALEKLIGDPRFGNTAIYALFAIPGHASGKVLWEALYTAKGRNLDTVINAVGRRRMANAIPKLARLASSSDPTTAEAALTALGDIGTGESLQALRRAQPAADLAIDRAWAELGAASRALAEDPVETRADVETAYREILGSTDPDPARIAALKGLAQAEGSAALPVVCDALGDGRARVRLSAANLFATVADGAAIVGISSRFSSLDPSVQAVILEALDTQRTPGALPLFQIGLVSPDATVRIAAIQGMGDVPDPAAIAPLLALLGADTEESQAVADSLGRLRAPGVVETLLAVLPGAPPGEKTALLKILAARADHRVYPLALAAVDDGDPAVRAAAFAAIAATSSQNDLPTVLALLPKTRTAAERRSMERALLEVVRAAPNPDTVADAIDRALVSTRGPARYSLLTALALAGTDHSSAILAGILGSPSAQDRREAINAIAGARNPRLDVLLIAAAREAPDSTESILALRDYLDLLQVPSGRSNEEIAEGYARAWQLADRAQEKDAIIAALRHMKTNAADAQAAKLEASRAKP